MAEVITLEKWQRTVLEVCMEYGEDRFSFGSGHIVFSDCNLADIHIDSCITEIRKVLEQEKDFSYGCKAEEQACLKLLLLVRSIPLEIREQYERQLYGQ